MKINTVMVIFPFSEIFLKEEGPMAVSLFEIIRKEEVDGVVLSCEIISEVEKCCGCSVM